MALCLHPDIVERIKQVDLSNTDSAQRVEIFKSLVGNEQIAKDISSIYESKLLLKNQNTAFNKFVSNIDGTTIKGREKMREAYQARVARNQNVMDTNPDQFKELIENTLAKKYKTEIPEESIDAISKLNKEVRTAKDLPKQTNGDYSLEYGIAKVKLNREIDKIVNPDSKLGFIDQIKANNAKVKADYKAAQGFFEKAGVVTKAVSDTVFTSALKAVKSSLDISYAFNQGFKQVLDSPIKWAELVGKSMKGFKGMGKDETIDAFHAAMFSNKGYNEAIESGLRLGGAEEYFKDSLFEKVPGLGNLIKMSDHAYTMFTQTSRLDKFNQMLEKATINGVKPSKEAMKDIANVANSFTGSGTFSAPLEQSVQNLNKIFYAPRYFKSTVDTYTLWARLGKMDPTARKEATKIMAKQVAFMASVLTTGAIFAPEKVGIDPRSSKFGKINIGGDRWVKVFGPSANFVTFMSRILPTTNNGKLGFYSTSGSGKVTKLNSGKFGSKTVLDVFTEFGLNKLSPVLNTAVKTWGKNEDFGGTKPTVGSILSGLSMPISTGNFITLLANEELMTAVIDGGLGQAGLDVTDYSSQKGKAQNPIDAIANKFK